MAISSRLTTTAAITRKARTADGQGGFTETYNAVGNISCRISRKSSKERVRANIEEGLGDYVMFTLTTVGVKVHDRVTVGTLLWEVISISRPSRGAHYEWDLQLIESGN